MKRISRTNLGNIALPIAPLAEQNRIANFLDRRCAEIDAVIERTKATIEEYKKLKQVVITEAVTKGVRGPRKMKDSGFEWIGEIPEEWGIVKLKYFLSDDKVNLRVGPFGSALAGSDFVEEGEWVYNQRIVLDDNFVSNDTFISAAKYAIGGKGKMMVVTASRLAAVRYFHEVKRYIAEKGYTGIDVMVAFSGAVKDGDTEYTESGLNVRKDGSHISEDQTKAEFHENFNVLIVAEKYQTGFDEPLLHTMIVDKKLRSVKCVQTLSRLNRICPGKRDTFVLDFVNTAEDIQEAFQPFYQETSLSQEVNTDLIYQLQKELRDYNIYSFNDVEAFCSIYYSSRKQDEKTFGKMTSTLKPVADRYNALTADERYNFRRQMRSYIKWYGYISQVCRMFDAEMQKEYVFCSYLMKLLPADAVQMMDIEGALKLEYYKLQQTFKGDIALREESVVQDPAGAKGAAVPEQKEPLEEVIQKINEMYSGEFGDADRVILYALHERLRADKKLEKVAKTSDRQIFTQSIFPTAFGTAAMDGYVEQTEAYTSLFENRSKYNAMMMALAGMMYREFNSVQGGV